MMEERRLHRSALFALLWIALAAAAATAATYAWFTNSAVTNVTPFDGNGTSVSDGEDNLTISLTQEGEFGKECKLQPDGMTEELQPVSTVDLEHFYEAVSQNRKGISLTFREVTENPGRYMIRGSIYLKSGKTGNDVYFYRDGLAVKTDAQTLSALRLGLRITPENGESSSYIFRLDELGNTTGAESKLTVSTANTVIRGVQQGGRADLVADPAKTLSTYYCVANPENEQLPMAGEEKLCTMEAQSTAKVDYWLYLEGCDQNCINSVQAKSVELQLAFAGVAVRKDAQGE